MSSRSDVVVVGLGAMGSAALRALARRGWKAIGIDRYAPPHAMGSTHGRSRIIREAYFEHPSYVPLVQRSYLLWEEIEREAGARLWTRTGGLMIGPPDGVLVSGALESARVHGLAHEVLDAVELRRRFPMFRPDPGMVAVWEPRASVLEPEACVEAFLAAARVHGAVVRTDEQVISWARRGEAFEVTTSRARYQTGHLVLAAGAWVGRLVPELDLPLGIERTVQFWFEAMQPESLTPDRFPVNLWEYAPGRFFYTFPADAQGFKAALHHEGQAADPERLQRGVGAGEANPLKELLSRHLPGAAGLLRTAVACMYTNTPDGDFVIDRHPQHPGVVVLSVCSGHGFKFAPVVGEIVSDLLVEGGTRWDVGHFGLGRWV